MKATRAEAYHAIDSERDYQAKWGKKPHETATFLTYMREYLRRAELLSTVLPDPESNKFAGETDLDMVRKITALGVACMEQNGAPKRRA